MIKVQNLQYKMDQRGYGLYNLYENELQGQVNCTTTKPGIIRAFHGHGKQTDYWICLKGNIHVILIECNFDITEYTPCRTIGIHDQEINLLAHKDPAKHKRFNKYSDIKIHHHYIGEKNPQMLTIPPGVLHGFSPMYGEEATLMYYTDKKYNPNDEYRVAWNFIGENVWLAENK